MAIRIFGAILVILGCGGFGIMIAANHKMQTRSLRQFIMTLDLMECELQYRQSSLPELCRIAAQNNTGALKTVFSALATELEKQISPSVEKCILAILQNTQDLPRLTKEAFLTLGQSLGRFDLEGQLKGINFAKTESQHLLERHAENQDARIRCYQTLSICAGAAVVILFI